MQLTKITSKNDLSTVLKGGENALQRLDEDKKEEFKKNFIELWSNEYLIKSANATELLDFCIQVSNIGLSVNPWHKQVYILPFNQKGQNGKKLEAVLTKFGIQELVFQSGFQIEVDTIWNHDGEEVLSKNLSIGQRSKLNITDIKEVDKNFLGFYFELIDLNKKLKKQNCVVGIDYLKEVTKQLQSKTHQIANYEHKAFRKAMTSFFIPKSRGSIEVISQLDNINNTIVDVSVNENKKETPKVALTLEEDENKTKDVTVKEILEYYNASDNKQKIADIMSNNDGWREYIPSKLNALMSEIQAV